MTSLQLSRTFAARAPGPWLRAHGAGVHAALGCGYAAPGIAMKRNPQLSQRSDCVNRQKIKVLVAQRRDDRSRSYFDPIT
jgi:hypothetical protein